MRQPDRLAVAVHAGGRSAWRHGNDAGKSLTVGGVVDGIDTAAAVAGNHDPLVALGLEPVDLFVDVGEAALGTGVVLAAVGPAHIGGDDPVSGLFDDRPDVVELAAAAAAAMQHDDRE